MVEKDIRERQFQAFLCHSSDDKDEIRKIYRRLSNDGYNCWLDEENILPGMDWKAEIAKAVYQSSVVLVCLSKNSVSKTGYIQKEIKFALDKADEMPEGKIYIIPVKLEECEVPTRLSRWHWVNMFDSDGYIMLLNTLKICQDALISYSEKDKVTEGNGDARFENIDRFEYAILKLTQELGNQGYPILTYKHRLQLPSHVAEHFLTKLVNEGFLEIYPSTAGPEMPVYCLSKMGQEFLQSNT